MQSLHRQRGQMLIGFVIAVGLFALAMAGVYRYWHVHEVQSRANRWGAAFSQWGVGLRGYTAAVQGGSAALPSNPYTVSGDDWLKPPTCGGLPTNPPDGYIPCTFDGFRVGDTYTTTIKLDPATRNVEARTWFFVPKAMVGPDGAGSLAAATAAATLSQQSLAANGAFYNVYPNTGQLATAPTPVAAILPGNRGRVLMVETTNPSYDLWLRVDGTNKMLADLNMGHNSIRDAKNGEFEGDLRVKGTAQIDNGLSVTNGTAQINDGVITKDVKVQAVGFMASQALYRMSVYQGSSVYYVPKPDCSTANAGASSPMIYAALQGTGSPKTAGGDALYSSFVQVTDAGSRWKVKPIVRSSRFTLDGSSSGGTLTLKLTKKVLTGAPGSSAAILVMTKCK